MIEARKIHLTSDCGHYEIIARLCSVQDSYTQDNWLAHKTYKGSYWSVIMKKDGECVDYIVSADERLYINFGEYGLCSYGRSLNKNTIIYGALCTGRFSKELTGFDRKKVEKQWLTEYVKARLEKEFGINNKTKKL